LSILTMILAGGTGKELSVLTRHRAKTALPFGGRYRIIDFALSNCVHSGLTDISILAQYSPKSLIYHIGMGKPWDLDRKVGGVFILQPTHFGEVAQWYLGTADALYQNIDVIRNSNAEHVLVLSGDQVYVMDYRLMVEHHIQSGSDVTIAIKEVSPSQRSRFGMIASTKEGVVTDFEEKPESSSLRFASLGIYLFDKKLLLDLLRPGRLDIVFDLIIPLFERKRVTCYRFDGYWEDIGSLQSYYRASLRLLRDRSLLSTPGWPIYTRGSNLPPATIAQGSRVADSILSDGCIVEGDVTGSVLFPGVRVEKGASIENSIVFSFTKIGREAMLHKAIVDKHVSVGAGSIVGVESMESVRGDARMLTEGVTRLNAKLAVLGKGAKLRRGSKVPTGVTVEPRYRPGRWGEE
jgi:glucose-1-phosphate adenylyltransferase